MPNYYRVTYKDEPSDVPSDIFYEVIEGNVLRLVEIDRDSGIYWNDLTLCSKDKEYSRSESLVEWNFDYSKFNSNNNKNEFWQIISKEEFKNWFLKAKSIGKRRWEPGVGIFIVEDGD